MEPRLEIRLLRALRQVAPYDAASNVGQALGDGGPGSGVRLHARRARAARAGAALVR